jgi:tRNA threonylcarbamoyl adenosine modification protein (Sua5/YciO/YrdC/YwlC family)
MSALVLKIHPDNPQRRLIKQVSQVLDQGGVIAYPTDSSYALGCHLGDKSALDRIINIRKVDDKHHYTLVGRDIAQITDYVQIGNQQYRLVKAYTPGPFTFILPAKRKVPRRSMHQKRRTIGIRIPDNIIVQDMLAELHEPILSSTLLMPGRVLPLGDSDDVIEQVSHQVDLIIDSGFCGIEPTTVIDWRSDAPEVVRQGTGQVNF